MPWLTIKGVGFGTEYWLITDITHGTSARSSWFSSTIFFINQFILKFKAPIPFAVLGFLGGPSFL